ncbi:TetR/AcrR family transcriptional regulator [Rhodococcus pyridinivorans]|uniref:TetR/AcrR family transcriptional regulator n=1 Tax=Rhodococcus pyridinivorans TaxID=103816 RepID=UPI003463AA8F
MSHRRSRRVLICEAALDLAAEGGNHALTHQGIDARLGLARGSTSYYYRTRHALVSAAIAHLTRRSREHFLDAVPSRPPETSLEAATLIAAQVETLLVERRRDVLARYALLADAVGDDELREGLASCLFSLPAATELLGVLGAPDPPIAARDLISLLEGLVFTHAFAARIVDAGTSITGHPETLQVSIRLWIDALTGRR